MPNRSCTCNPVRCGCQVLKSTCKPSGLLALTWLFSPKLHLGQAVARARTLNSYFGALPPTWASCASGSPTSRALVHFVRGNCKIAF